MLLREYALINATSYNRKSFLQQMNKVFHTTPYFTIVTALDYHQMLCLLCSDFPKGIIIEAIKVLEPEQSNNNDSNEEDNFNADSMISMHKLGTLQKAVAIFFYYNGIFKH